MSTTTLPEQNTGWTIAEPPQWCRDDRLVLMELVPARPEPLESGPDAAMEESLGVELWRAVRFVRRWAKASPEEREGLFGRSRAAASEIAVSRAEACARAPELAPALATFAALTDSPGTVNAGDLVLACRAVVSWAEERGMPETGIHFVEAAAAVMPESAALANLAGRTCRGFGRRGRSELWYDRAIGLARNTPGKRGTRQYIRAHLGFATTLLEIEDHVAALEHINAAGRAAKGKGMRGKAAEAFHDAFSLAMLEGQFGQATIYARRAVSIYPYHHARYPALGHDFGLLLVSRGLYVTALSILQSAVKRISGPAEQLVAWGTLARAAAGAGRESRFREAVARVDTLVPTFGQTAAAGLYNVGEGARLLGLWTKAQCYTEAALEHAESTGNVQILTRSRVLLEAIGSRDPGLPELRRDDGRGAVLRRIAPAVRLRLAKWRGPTWRPRQLGPEDLDDY